MSHVYKYMSPEDQRKRDERDLLILRLRENNMTIPQVAKRVGVHPQTVLTVLRDLKEHI